jgi:hypothetical protein
MLAAASLTINAQVVSFLLGSLLPFIHDALVKLGASSKIKSAVAIVLSALGSFVQSAIRPDGSAVFSGATLSSFFIILITSRNAYKQYQSLGLQGKILPGNGIG